MFLSFIIPVYNGEAYLAECLDSLLQQEVPANEYEVVIVDDGSTDATGEILKTYCAAYGNILRFAQNHLGVSAARNRGLREAHGDYVWFVDADDFIQDDALPELKRFAETGRYDRILFDTYICYGALTAEEAQAKAAGTICSNTGASAVSSCASLFRRAFLLETGQRFREGLVVSEDELFLYEIQLHNPTQASLPRVLYYWRRNPISTTMSENKVSMPQRMESRLQIMKQLKEYYQTRQGDLSQCADYLMGNLWTYLMNAAGMNRKSCRDALRKLKEVGLYPFRRPPECTLRKTYMTTRTDLFGKLYEYVGMHLHRRWGFVIMRVYCLLKGNR